MKPETAQTEAQAKANTRWFAESKKLSKKERLLALAQKMTQENAENVNEMFEIMKLED